MARDREKRPEAKSRRLFVAVELPPEAQDAIDEAIAPWREALERARWAPRDNRHATVKFVGWTWPRLVDFVRDGVAAAAAAAAPFEIGLAGPGRFPARGLAAVLWVGLDDPSGGLAALAEAVESALEREFPRERRPFAAHVTVARSRPPIAVPEGYAAAPIPQVSWRVDRAVLFESHLERPHARYEALARLPLGG